MGMKKILFYCLLAVNMSFAQNQQILYDFGDLPQTLLLNPGAIVHNKFHIGVPMLSNNSANAGFSGFSIYELFADDGSDINSNLKRVVDNFGRTEFFSVSQQLEVINIGYRVSNYDYLSFGYYETIESIGKIPRDLVDLYYDGNTVMDRKYSIDKLGLQADFTGVFHIGYSKKVRENLQLGARLKLYSGAINITATRNKGYLLTQLGTNNIYEQRLDDVNILARSSGLYLKPGEEADFDYFRSKLLLGGNLGLGLDLGFTYKLKEQWLMTGSILDLGFVNNSSDVRSRKVLGDFQIDGFQFYFDPNSPEDYWESLSEEFEEEIISEELTDSYLSIRPIKLNASISYSFGQSMDDCRFLIDPDLYNNKIGAHLFSLVSPVHTYLAATVFYEKRFTPFLQAKLTYTIDPFSFSNFGCGLSLQTGPLNLYFTAENLLRLNNIYNSKHTGFTLGMNLIFNGKK